METARWVLKEDDGKRVELSGRTVNWLFTPESMKNQYLSACTVEIAPLQRALPAHSHPGGEEAIYVVQGEGKVLIGAEIYEIREGSIMLMPQGIPHMLHNTSERSILKAICVYGPGREAVDYAYHEEVDFPEFKSKGK